MKKKILGSMIIFMFVFLFASLTFAHEHPGYSYDEDVGTTNPNWMGSIKDSARLSELSIPGTHDSMTYQISVPAVKNAETQTMSLETQLNSGIRFLDIRARYYDGSFAMHHGIYYLDNMFGDVLDKVTTFLKENPSETIFMRIKQEYSEESNDTFNQTLKEYMDKYPGYFFDSQYRTNTNPTLKEMRGKIVILLNVGGSNIGLDYAHDFNIQDKYHLDTNWDLYDKWLKVKEQLNKANESNRTGSKTKFINYLSGSGGSFPYFVASGHLSQETSAPRLSTGLTTIGWPDEYPDFPRTTCLGELCTISFEGTNVLATDYIAEKNLSYVGIVAADFPGKGLINNVIKVNKNLLVDWITLDGKTYYYEDGKMIMGWKEIKGKHYYFSTDSDGTGLKDGEMATGFIKPKPDDIPYFFNEDGTGMTGWKVYDGKRYYFENGKSCTGWKEIAGKHYYFSPPGDGTGLKNGEMAMDWRTLDGKHYYFSKPGDGTGLKDGEMAMDWRTLDGKKYYFSKPGDKTGLKDGEMAMDWRTLDGKKYYFSKPGDGTGLKDGEMATGFIKPKPDDIPYFFNEDGTGMTGWKVYDGKRYYFENGKSCTGWKEIAGKRYYFSPPGDGTGLKNGEMAVDVIELNGVEYDFDENGVWQKPIIEDGTYQIVSALNNKSIVDFNQSTDNVALWQNNHTNTQKWVFKYNVRKKAYKIMTMDGNRSLAWQSYNNGNNVVVAEGDWDDQYWVPANMGNGYFILRNMKDQNQVLDVTNSGSSDGTNIQAWAYNGSNAQKFKLVQEY